MAAGACCAGCSPVAITTKTRAQLAVTLLHDRLTYEPHQLMVPAEEQDLHPPPMRVLQVLQSTSMLGDLTGPA